MLKSIGIFGGTFDPIHHGHLRAAVEVQENLGLEQIQFIPCLVPPQPKTPVAEATHRVNMTQLATQGVSTFTVNSIELSLPTPSYTINTLLALRKQYPETSLSLIVGTDAFLNLPNWHRWEELTTLANIIVLDRADTMLPSKGILDEFFKKNHLKTLEPKDITAKTHGFIVKCKTTILPISASFIRSLLKQGRLPWFLTPNSVCEYIHEKKLYGVTA